MSYTAWSVVYGEQPTASKWNQLGSNDAGFKDGTNIDDDAILARHISGFDKSNLTSDVNPYKFRAYRSSAWTTPNSAFGKVQHNAEDFDSNNNYDSTTNFRYTAPVAGFYLFTCGAEELATGAGNIRISTFFKNGAEISRGIEILSGGTGNTNAPAVAFLQLSASDYIEAYTYGTNKTGDVSSKLTYFTGILLCRT